MMSKQQVVVTFGSRAQAARAFKKALETFKASDGSDLVIEDDGIKEVRTQQVGSVKASQEADVVTGTMVGVAIDTLG